MRWRIRFDPWNALALILAFSPALHAGDADLNLAEQQYQRADYSGAIHTLLSYEPKTARANALLGKSYYMEGQYKSSTTYLEKAVAQDGSSSSDYDWLGKAYGRRAEQSSLITALPLAIKTRKSFERAVALDSTSLEALGDLFEYYLQAPAVVGGGSAKAEAVAARIAQLSEPESHYVQARLAEKRGDNVEAEQEYRKAMEAAPHDVGRVVDLATFLSDHRRFQESDNLFNVAGQIEPSSPKVMFARAASYIHSGRNLPEAKTMLQHYLALPHTPDDPAGPDVAQLTQGFGNSLAPLK